MIFEYPRLRGYFFVSQNWFHTKKQRLQRRKDFRIEGPAFRCAFVILVPLCETFGAAFAVIAVIAA